MSDQTRTDAEPAPAAPVPVVVKKYANRRLYNTETSSYITLDNLATLVREGRDFVVYDAKSGDDITRSVLTQIIVEEEGKGRNLLPTAFLRQLIGFYGDQMQALVPRFLEQSMSAFAQQQDQIRAAMQKTMGNFFPFSNVSMEEVSRQNIAMVERAMSLFSPFYRQPEGLNPSRQEPPIQPNGELEAEIVRLRAENDSLRQKLATATTPKPSKRNTGSPQSGNAEGSDTPAPVSQPLKQQ